MVLSLHGWCDPRPQLHAQSQRRLISVAALETTDSQTSHGFTLTAKRPEQSFLSYMTIDSSTSKASRIHVTNHDTIAMSDHEKSLTLTCRVHFEDLYKGSAAKSLVEPVDEEGGMDSWC